jgi:hypothetical protein
LGLGRCSGELELRPPPGVPPLEAPAPEETEKHKHKNNDHNDPENAHHDLLDDYLKETPSATREIRICPRSVQATWA